MIPEIAVGAIIAAIITGIISLIGLIISKENKVSEFRQKWIDDLREDISILLSEMHVISAYISSISTYDEEFINNSKEHYCNFNSSLSRVRLRVNPEEELSKELLTELSELDRILELHPNERARGDTKKYEERIQQLSRKILKKEWSRVKQGEKIYSLTIRFTTILVFFLILLAFIIA